MHTPSHPPKIAIMTGAAVDGPLLDANYVKSLMSSEGPVVKAVLLEHGGTQKEINVDMTPAKNELSKLLGGSPTFVGQYTDIEAVVMARRDHDSPDSTMPKNANELKYPLHEVSVCGDMVVLKMVNAEPTDMKLSEYSEWREKEPVLEEEEEEEEGEGENEEGDEGEDDDESEDDGEENEEEENSADDGEQEGEDDEEDEDDADDDDEGENLFHQMLFNKVYESFKAEHGREPTEEELTKVMDSLNAVIGAEENHEECSNEEHEETSENKSEVDKGTAKRPLEAAGSDAVGEDVSKKAKETLESLL
jgi:hypothetical protein